MHLAKGMLSICFMNRTSGIELFTKTIDVKGEKPPSTNFQVGEKFRYHSFIRSIWCLFSTCGSRERILDSAVLRLKKILCFLPCFINLTRNIQLLVSPGADKD